MLDKNNTEWEAKSISHLRDENIDEGLLKDFWKIGVL